MGILSHQTRLTTSGAGNGGIQSAAVTGNGEQVTPRQVPASTTDQLIPIAFTRAALQSIYLTTDRAITLKTNSTGSPPDTFTIAAGGTFHWQVGSGIAVPFTADVTAFYITTPSGAATSVECRVLTS